MHKTKSCFHGTCKLYITAARSARPLFTKPIPQSIPCQTARMSAVELLDQAIAQVDKMLAVATISSAEFVAPAKPQPVPQAAPKQKPAAATPKPAPASSAPAAVVDSNASGSLFDKILIKVARIVSVEQLANSEKLYKLQVDLGTEKRQVCAGLRMYLPASALENLLVCVVCNLKVAKLAGEVSEAMILAGDTEVEGALVVRTLIPPAGSEPGEQVHLQGSAPSSATAKVLKSDDFKKISALLCVKGGAACYDGVALSTAKGTVTLPAEIPDGSSIH